MASQVKVCVMRVVTHSRVVPWHLGKTLKLMATDFDIVVVGENVSEHKNDYPNVLFIDIPLTPKISFIKDIIALFKLVNVIRAYRPKIIHSIMPKAGLMTSVASFFYVPVRIHTFTGQVWQNMGGLGRLSLKYIDNIIVSLNTQCFTDSPSQSVFLCEEGVSDRGVALPVISKGSLSGVDLNKIAIANRIEWRRKIRERYKISDDIFVIGYLARKTREKGALLMLDAFHQLQNRYPFLLLMFVGPDDSQGELQRYKVNTPAWCKNVIEIDSVTGHEEYLAAFDLFCLPSYREGFGSIVIDAAALAIPTVGSRISGLTDAIVDSSTGKLFECGDCDDLVDKLTFFIESPEYLKIYGDMAFERTVNCFDSSVICSELKKVYLDLSDDR